MNAVTPAAARSSVALAGAPPDRGHGSADDGCLLCRLQGRRRFGGWLLAGAAGAFAGPVWAQREAVKGSVVGAGGAPAPAGDADAGVQRDVGKTSGFTKFVSAEQIEGSAAQQYLQLKREAAGQRALAPPSHPQAIRLRAIADRIIPFTSGWNERARQWQWEVSLLGSKELNAFCMPGGKIAFYYGILQKLQLSDDEVATIMGHEVAHALREHARERIGKTMATRGALEVGAALLGLGDAGRLAAGLGGQLLTLKFGRDDETEADIVGMDLAARAGYDPAAGVTLWQKMMAANKGAPPKWLSTHPSGVDRIQEIRAKLPKVQPLYARAAKPTQRFEPPPVA